jgi:hypothetical protein
MFSDLDFAFSSEKRNISETPFFENNSKITSIPRSIWNVEIFLVFKNPFK